MGLAGPSEVGTIVALPYLVTVLFQFEFSVTRDGAQAYAFDQANRMCQASGKATYRYDGWVRRVSVVGTDCANRVQVYAQDGRLMYAGPTSAAKTKYVYLHIHVVAEVGGAGTQYIHTDGLGSPVAQTNPAKGLISRTRYEPFGRCADHRLHRAHERHRYRADLHAAAVLRSGCW